MLNMLVEKNSKRQWRIIIIWTAVTVFDHRGNFFGAIFSLEKMQNEYETYKMFIVLSHGPTLFSPSHSFRIMIQGSKMRRLRTSNSTSKGISSIGHRRSQASSHSPTLRPDRIGFFIPFFLLSNEWASTVIHPRPPKATVKWTQPSP